MSDQRFIVRLGLLTLGIAVVVALLRFSPALGSDQDLAWWSITTFAILCLIMYRIGKKTIQLENKNTFTFVFMGFTGLKMFLAFILVGIYYKTHAPSSKLFIVPFFVIYTAYTVFEVWFMTKLAKWKPTDD